MNYENIVYIIGNLHSCFVFGVDKKITEIKISISNLGRQLKEYNYLQINNYTLINTRFFVKKEGKQQIKMNDGSQHKLFRRQHKQFLGENI